MNPVSLWSIAIFVCLNLSNTIHGYPIHASCKIDWTFGMSCDMVKQKLVAQIAAWKTADNCAQGGEKCLYATTFQNSTFIQGTHVTPVHHYTDDISFAFIASGSTCRVHGYSSSQTWYAYLDYGTNYCNLHNLITGSSLDKASGYTETTSDSICTEYSSANCDKY